MRKLFGDGVVEKLLSRTFGRSSGKSGKGSFGSWGNKRASLLRGNEKKQVPLVPTKRSPDTSELDYDEENGRSSWDKVLIAGQK